MMDKPDYETPLKRAELISEIHKWYEDKFKDSKVEFMQVSVFDLIADFVMQYERFKPSSNEESKERLREALEFYANPETYIATSLVVDRPCGEIDTDYSHTEMGSRLGKRARQALKDEVRE